MFGNLILPVLFMSGPNTYNENETIAKYEIMDGAPVRGTCLIKLCKVLWMRTLILPFRS